jgi:hypothetical protein
MEYVPGKSLLMYLRELGAVALLRRLRVLDTAHVDLGRRRSSYVLQEDSYIVMLSSRTGISSHLQRGYSSDDVKKLAYNMGGGERVVEVNINYQDNQRSDK